MTEEAKLVDEPDDNADLAHLPPKERARMRRLRDWLAVSVWGPSHADAVLCGYDPEVGPNNCSASMAFFPGAHDFYGVPVGTREPDDLRALDAGIEEQRGYVGGLRLTTMPPQEVIAKTIAAGVPIPWLKDARADLGCRKYLPPEALDATANDEGSSNEKTPRQIAAVANANFRWEQDDTRKLIIGTGREAFDAFRATGFEGVQRHENGRWAGRLNRSDLVRKILAAIRDAAPDEVDLWPDPQSVERAVGKWLSSGE